ncbi:receptor-like protein kinase 7 [Typha angustifolia]|uniref:receptor-like protein kinase 7 n=1 Tax=Typha angustifolia TaxID=59011 RepID=UPI003C2B125E
MHLLFLLLCLFSGLIEGSTSSEVQILLDLRNSLGITNSSQGFGSWFSENSPCNFSGVLCDSNGSVSEIDLYDRGISGNNIPFDSLCQLPSLTKLSLGSNLLSSPLTADIRNCTSLLYLDLAFNSFSGAVPDLSPLRNLQVLNISSNYFTGPFPWDSLSNLTELLILSLGDNGYERSPFPKVLMKLTKLYWLYLSVTNLEGEIPSSIANLTKLRDLEFSDNFLSGQIPPEISKLTKLTQLEFYNNSFTGKLPTGFGNLSELAYFDASMNSLKGDLSELRFLKKLVSLQLFYNDFSGEIPAEFGDFRYLVNLSLYSNRLSGKLPEKIGSWSEFNFIDVSTNFLTGPIPPDMCNKGTMKKLLVLENKFSGEIPASYAKCSTLKRLRVSNNSLSGVVPAGIWSLPNVNIIDLAVNGFTGPVGAGIGEAKSLYQLFLANNHFSGELPTEISQAVSLVSIDASFNELSGSIPATIGALKSVVSIDLEGNSISGAIPYSIGDCDSLNTINLAKNNLSGVIPVSLGRLSRLNSLDLSGNDLSGEIPASLASLKLSFLNLSDNSLAGEVPAALSIDAYSASFSGNPDLCINGNARFLRRCSPSDGGSSDKLRVVLTCLIVGATLLLASLAFLVYLKRRRSYDDARDRSAPKKSDSWDLKSFRILTFDEDEILKSIKQENIIGSGASGKVYRVHLASGKVVAVKHIWNSPAPTWAGAGAGSATSAMLATAAPRRLSSMRCREFDAEVGTLSSIRHVNVVKLYCSITSEDSSLLVYEHLPNGNLWERLHTTAGDKLGALDWDTRYEIAVGSAKGLEYLHHGCDRPILHRDVKSSNILLDEYFKPRIADFGLAKILHSAPRDSSTHVIAGTHGYIAPEYAYTYKVTEKSDVYSFGVVLMELVTGRKPIEAEYGENKDIVYWISRMIDSKERVMGLIDRRITKQWALEEAVKVLRVAVLCTARLPAMRPSMRTVVQMLEEAATGRPFAVADGEDEKVEVKLMP